MKYKLNFQESRDKQRVKERGFFPQSGSSISGIWVRSEVEIEIKNIKDEKEVKETLKRAFMSVVDHEEFELLKNESYINISYMNKHFAEIQIINSEISVLLKDGYYEITLTEMRQ